MRNQIFGSFIAFLLVATPCAAATSTKTLNESMTEIGTHMATCFPLILAQRELSLAEKNTIIHCVEQLKTLFHEVEPHIRKKSETYQISYQFVTEHLENTDKALRTDNFDFIRFRLRTLGSICTSCHTQDKKLRTLFAGTTRQQFDSDNAYAEFNYLTRNYDQAEVYYDRYLRSDDVKTDVALIKPLQRLTIIYAQVYNRPGDGAAVLEKYKTLKGHSGATLASLTGWIEGLRELEKNGAGKLNNLDMKTLDEYVTRYLVSSPIMPAVIYSTPSDEMKRVWLRGQLFQYLNNNPGTDDMPKILYWLSICDRAIGYDFDFSLADYYLKNCVYRYPQGDYAQRCYDEYENYVTFFNNGVTETELPIEVDRELAKMRKTMDAAKKGKKHP